MFRDLSETEIPKLLPPIATEIPKQNAQTHYAPVTLFVPKQNQLNKTLTEALMNCNSEGRIKRLHAVVQGRVQGVGFRYYAAENAAYLQLTGFCRNLRNGDVEVVAEGEEGALEALLAALKRGPASSHVENVITVWTPAIGEYRSFIISQTR